MHFQNVNTPVLSHLVTCVWNVYNVIDKRYYFMSDPNNKQPLYDLTMM